jgi:hypothetical protein
MGIDVSIFVLFVGLLAKATTEQEKWKLFFEYLAKYIPHSDFEVITEKGLTRGTIRRFQFGNPCMIERNYVATTLHEPLDWTMDTQSSKIFEFDPDMYRLEVSTSAMKISGVKNGFDRFIFHIDGAYLDLNLVDRHK